MYEVQTVEVRFRGEQLATETIEDAGVYTLYRTPLNDYYVHHVDEDRGFSWLVTHRNRNDDGELLEGLEDWQVRALWPDLAEAAGLGEHDPYKYVAAEEDWRLEHEMMD